MQQSEGGKREVGGEGERNVGKHMKREPKPNSSDGIEECFLEM